ncbi:hypothetical protein L249_1042 [Ophiocordyceps polyrhachis-furcata BCC 54312]|uniref:Uncharacterized protein n=1 Tax=Ophiocordyceps polyrhachis-furcata BCC 54312 TaxID=1330021 RepID=A0A367LEC4_9HYPO|nr:hypothetical protein L249_1042 [Ophiocordyceps polyrhachis-furcata BCC 54312]
MNKADIIVPIIYGSGDDAVIEGDIIIHLAAHPTRNNGSPKIALMMVEAQTADVVLAADVDDGVARLETVRIAGADQRRVVVLRKHA